MKTFLSNAFSLNMLSGDGMLNVTESSPDGVPKDAISCIGHESTAVVAGALLGQDVAVNRVAVSLARGDVIYVITLFDSLGKPYRAPEGVTLGQDELLALRLVIRRVEVL